LNGDTGAFAEYLRNLKGALLIGDCVGCDETDPEMAYVDSAMLGEDLLNGALNGRGEFFEGDIRRGHIGTSQGE
jgi:hypothetical protein